MFRGNKVINEKYSISEYIDGDDIFNSELVLKIVGLPSAGEYLINKYQYRIDLIASELYGDSKYSQILMLFNGLSITDLKIGLKIKYPSKEVIDDLINEINKR